MHHSSPSAITYPSPPALLPHLTAPRPTPALLHPALLPTSLPHHQHLPPAPALLHLALLHTSLPHHLHLPYSTTRLSILDPPTLPMCTLLPIHSCAFTCYTYYPAHRTHVPHSTPPSPSPPQMHHAPPIPYRLYHIALPRIPLSSI